MSAAVARHIQFAQECCERVTAVNLGIWHLVDDLDGHGERPKCK